MNSSELIIVGTGETARLAYNYFMQTNKYSVVAFAVSQEYLKSDSFLGLPVCPLENINNLFPPSTFVVFVAVGSNRLNQDRMNLFCDLKSKGYSFASYVSPDVSFLSDDVKIGENCFILEGNVLQSGVTIGDNVTLWSGNHVGHCSMISDHCFISSHCVISGFVKIGSRSFLGVNSTIEDNASIGVDNFIGASVLIRGKTPDNSVYQTPLIEPSKVSAKRLFKVK